MSSMKPIHARAWADWEISVARPLMYCHGGLERAEGRQRLFEKALTPSDVGKLNRLVIPKQHAEKHFPLDGESGDKGLLMTFEDETGKPWRFRYSYWGSSQSYVLTKGWSRFVKEKKLDAGDVVSFERLHSRGAGERLSISCRRSRRRPSEEIPPPEPQPPAASAAAAPASSKATAPMQSKRRLRLFGVNLDCTLEATTGAIDASAADQSLQYRSSSEI